MNRAYVSLSGYAPIDIDKPVVTCKGKKLVLCVAYPSNSSLLVSNGANGN